MMTSTPLTPASSHPPEPFTGQLRLAVAAYLAQFKGSSRIGICGILRAPSSPAPRAIQWPTGALAVAALAIACTAIFTVGRVAYPAGDALDGDHAVAGGAARLRAGIRLTIVALILAAIAALSGWWPAPSSSPAVAVTSTTG